MKDLSKLIVLFLLMFLVSAVYAQEQELSWTAKRLKEQVKNGEYKVILEAADTSDITLIPYLKQLTSNSEGRKNHNHPSFYAHVALAKLGDDEAIQQILAEVDNKSPAIQSSGMHKLSLVGGKVAFRKFYELLDDTKPREDTDCQKMFEEHNKKHPENKLSPYCHVMYLSRSVTAMFYLKKMVENPPVKTFYGTQKEIDIWKEWFKKNNHLVN
jgi:hypothetical protein